MRNKFIFLFLFLFSTSIYAKTEAHFSPNKENEKILVDLIDSTEKTLDIAIYSLTIPSVSDSIVAAQNRGVKVRMIVDLQQTFVKKSLYSFLKKSGIPIVRDKYSGLMHDKYLISDSKILETGSFNYTGNAVSNNHENFIVTDDPALIASFQADFDKMWQENK